MIRHGDYLYTALTNNTATNITFQTTWPANSYPYQVVPAGVFPSQRIESPTVEDEVQWLRRRVSEVCAAVAA